MGDDRPRGMKIFLAATPLQGSEEDMMNSDPVVVGWVLEIRRKLALETDREAYLEPSAFGGRMTRSHQPPRR